MKASRFLSSLAVSMLVVTGSQAAGTGPGVAIGIGNVGGAAVSGGHAAMVSTGGAHVSTAPVSHAGPLPPVRRASVHCGPSPQTTLAPRAICPVGLRPTCSPIPRPPTREDHAARPFPPSRRREPSRHASRRPLPPPARATLGPMPRPLRMPGTACKTALPGRRFTPTPPTMPWEIRIPPVVAATARPGVTGILSGSATGDITIRSSTVIRGC